MNEYFRETGKMYCCNCASPMKREDWGLYVRFFCTVCFHIGHLIEAKYCPETKP